VRFSGFLGDTGSETAGGGGALIGLDAALVTGVGVSEADGFNRPQPAATNAATTIGIDALMSDAAPVERIGRSK
jgi:hypothetical protein